jgi:acyl-coenzyme A synthetase/AMP-(fatty) acid ligase
LSQVQDRVKALLGSAPRDRAAVAFGDSTWTWRDIAECAHRVTRALDDLNLGVDARVGIILRNRPQDVAAILALVASGRCIVALSPLQPAGRLLEEVDDNAPAVVIVAPETLDVPGLGESLLANGPVVLLGDDGSVRSESTRSARGRHRPAVAGTCIEIATSGTTGKPKRIGLSYDQMDRSLVSAGISFADSGDGTVQLASGVQLLSTPAVHISGFWNVISTLYAGRLLVVMDRFVVADWVALVTRYRPRVTVLVPAAMRMVLAAEVPREQLASLVAVLSGTAPCPPDLADEMFQRYGIRVLMIYGATEFAGAVAGWDYETHVAWWDTKRGAAGRPFRGVQMRVVDDTGNVVEPGESGTLEILSKQATNRGAGWMRTSDLARIDEDGFLWIDGRADDAITRGGFKVHPSVVRKALEAHPDVVEAAVAGIPDDRLGAVPVAAVEVRVGRDLPSSVELREFVRATLMPYEVPVRILVLDALPRNAAMKVDRTELLSLLESASSLSPPSPPSADVGESTVS